MLFDLKDEIENYRKNRSNCKSYWVGNGVQMMKEANSCHGESGLTLLLGLQEDFSTFIKIQNFKSFIGI